MALTGGSRVEAAVPAASPARRRPLIRLVLLINIASVLAVLALWAAATGLGWIAPVFLPSPGAVAKEAGALLASGQLWMDVLMSSKRVFLGFALAGLVAVPLGIV